MPRKCSICGDPRREEIDRALLSGKTYREITGNFPVSKSALERHRDHITASLRKAKEAEEIARGDDLVEDLRALAVEANRLKAEAEKSRQCQGCHCRFARDHSLDRTSGQDRRRTQGRTSECDQRSS
jgi:hypothetical protein